MTDSGKKYAKVIINLALDRTFDYLIPEHLKALLDIGWQVNVPFNHSERRGYIVGFSESPSHKGEIKKIISVCEKESRIPPSLIELGIWISRYYCCSREQAVRALLPGAVRSGKIKNKTVKLYSEGENGVIRKITANKRLKAQHRILKALSGKRQMSAGEIAAETETGHSPLKALIKAGAVTESSARVKRDPYENAEIIPSNPKAPTPEQEKALNTLKDMLSGKLKERVMLLHGITGSGKTEVYLQAIAEAIKTDREAIVLVPEISLTPQTVERFRARFGEKVSVIHSGLTDGERFDEWEKVSSGKVKIAVGARSALFAPFRNLALIIVDEEHENSYKQDKAPRHHARDVAVMRGKIEKAVVILGSATPSFESYWNAMKGKYSLASLKERADNCVLPSIRLIDMRMEDTGEGKTGFFSKCLINAVRERIRAGEQSIIFLNRRGYARQMMCEHCGFVAECSDCSIAYTYHKKKQTLSCHLCASEIPAPEKCPDCGAPDIRYTGLGTEKLEAVAGKFFKGARIARMDSDSMRNREDYERVLDSFKKGELDILIGTQMIAKGLHFPNVTLVGVINADQGLHIPDFRAPEKTFQLLTQVAGRAGRGEIKGEVIIQTYTPFNPAIQAALNHDYEGFFEEEIEMRHQLMYPPGNHLTAIHIKGKNPEKTEAYAEYIMKIIEPELNDNIQVSPPAPAPIERIKGYYRFMILFRGTKTKKLKERLRQCVIKMKHPADIEIYTDVDAVSLM